MSLILLKIVGGYRSIDILSIETNRLSYLPAHRELNFIIGAHRHPQLS